MEVRMNIPDDIAIQLQANGDIARRLLEMAALEGYKSGEFTAHQLREMLGFDTRMEVDGFLKAHGVALEYTLEDFVRERAALDALLDK
jgi:Uncharacterised protein family (UPF0175)